MFVVIDYCVSHAMQVCFLCVSASDLSPCDECFPASGTLAQSDVLKLDYVDWYSSQPDDAKYVSHISVMQQTST